MPGWSESTVGVKRFDELPKAAQDYLKRIEEICGVPVDLISTGAGPRGDDRAAPSVRGEASA